MPRLKCRPSLLQYCVVSIQRRNNFVSTSMPRGLMDVDTALFKRFGAQLGAIQEKQYITNGYYSLLDKVHENTNKEHNVKNVFKCSYANLG